jgi:AcrR family transcriptional regulator
MTRAQKSVNPDETGIPWWPAAGTGRGTLSRERLAVAAAEILETGGRSALTLRGVAQAVGAGTMSLYWYIDSKDDLVDLAVDRIMSAVDVPEDGDWRSRLRQLALSFRAVLLAHPAVLPLLAEGVTVGPHLLRIQEGLLTALLDAGLSAPDAARASTAVGAIVTNVGVGSPTADEAARWSAGKTLADLGVDRFPNTVALADELVGGDAEERFLFGLDLLLDGLAARLGHGEQV